MLASTIDCVALHKHPRFESSAYWITNKLITSTDASQYAHRLVRLEVALELVLLSAALVIAAGRVLRRLPGLLQQRGLGALALLFLALGEPCADGPPQAVNLSVQYVRLGDSQGYDDFRGQTSNQDPCMRSPAFCAQT